MRIGAHLSIAKGFSQVLERAETIGANCLQIFSSAPQQWSVPTFSDTVLSQFQKESIKRNIFPIFVHGTYLINLASDDMVLVQKSKKSLIADLCFAENIGEGLIGSEGFPVLLHDSQLSTIPFILETPGFDKKGPDKENIDRVRSFLTPLKK